MMRDRLVKHSLQQNLLLGVEAVREFQEFQEFKKQVQKTKTHRENSKDEEDKIIVLDRERSFCFAGT